MESSCRVSFLVGAQVKIISIYLVYGACSFIVMDVAVKRNIHFVFLPKSLQTFPSHGLFKCALQPIPVVGGIPEHPMGNKDQPRLLLPIHRCKAFLNEPVLFRPLPPVMFAVSYTEVKHAIICRVPVWG